MPIKWSVQPCAGGDDGLLQAMGRPLPTHGARARTTSWEVVAYQLKKRNPGPLVASYLPTLALDFVKGSVSDIGLGITTIILKLSALALST